MKKIKISLIMVMIIFILSACHQEDSKLESPGVITIDYQTITVEEIEHAQSYVLIINDEVIELEDRTYIIDDYGTFDVSYYAKSNDYLDSDQSEVFNFTIDPLVMTLSYKYSIYSTFDLPILNVDNQEIALDITMNESYQLNTNDYHITDQVLYIDSSYLTRLTAQRESYTFEFSIGLNLYSTVITIIDTDKPYAYTDNNVAYEGEDLKFYFDMFDYELDSFYTTGNIKLDADNYSFEDNVLTFSKDYIEGVFAENVSFYTISISYLFKENTTGDIHIGYLLIHNPE